jgi:pilus assembly protein CpaB
MRAVTFGISETSGVAGLVFPGDRVDMLLTQDLSGQNGESGEARRASETVLENVRILAIGRQLDDTGEAPVGGKTATIEVTPKQAEMVAVLVELGRLSLALRSLADEEAEASGHVMMSSAAPAGESGLPMGDAALPGTLADADTAVTADIDGGAATAAPAEAPVPPMDDNPPPSRGQTYTYDSEVSRLLGDSSDRVLVQRGNSTEQVTFQ